MSKPRGVTVRVPAAIAAQLREVIALGDESLSRIVSAAASELDARWIGFYKLRAGRGGKVRLEIYPSPAARDQAARLGIGLADLLLAGAMRAAYYEASEAAEPVDGAGT